MCTKNKKIKEKNARMCVITFTFASDNRGKSCVLYITEPCIVTASDKKNYCKFCATPKLLGMR